MNIVYTGEPIDYSSGSWIFLAGPTPRAPELVESYRPEMCRALKGAADEAGVTDLNVLLPEWRDVKKSVDFMPQVEWEKRGLTGCGHDDDGWRCTPKGCILFWVPREMKLLPTEDNIQAAQDGKNVFLTMPALTTNVEFGRHVGCKRVVYGRPDGTPHNDYLDWLYKDVTGKEPCRSMEEIARQAIRFCV